MSAAFFFIFGVFLKLFVLLFDSGGGVSVLVRASVRSVLLPCLKISRE